MCLSTRKGPAKPLVILPIHLLTCRRAVTNPMASTTYQNIGFCAMADTTWFTILSCSVLFAANFDSLHIFWGMVWDFRLQTVAECDEKLEWGWGGVRKASGDNWEFSFRSCSYFWLYAGLFHPTIPQPPTLKIPKTIDRSRRLQEGWLKAELERRPSYVGWSEDRWWRLVWYSVRSLLVSIKCLIFVGCHLSTWGASSWNLKIKCWHRD